MQKSLPLFFITVANGLTVHSLENFEPLARRSFAICSGPGCRTNGFGSKLRRTVLLQASSSMKTNGRDRAMSVRRIRGFSAKDIPLLSLLVASVLGASAPRADRK